MAGRQTRRRKVELVERRQKVSELYFGRRLTQQEIAERLDVDQSTISRDVTFLEKQWQEAARGPVDTVKGKELAELNAMEDDAAIEYLRTREVKWMSERRQIKASKAKLMGLDAPKKVEVHDWRKEIKEYGIDPDEALDGLTSQFVKAMQGSDAEGSVEASKENSGTGQ